MALTSLAAAKQMVEPLKVYSIAVTLACIHGTQPALADVKEKYTHEFYEAYQQPGRTLLEALDAATPTHKGGKHYHGLTRWKIRWDFEWTLLPSRLCQITSVTTSLSIHMILPRLKATTPVGSFEFTKYFNALRTHEEGHRAIAQKAAFEVDRAIAGLRRAEHCQALEQEANQIGMAIIKRANEADLEYDVLTQSGCTQGACLPFQ